MPFPNDQPGTSQSWYPVPAAPIGYEPSYTQASLPVAGAAYRGTYIWGPGDGTTTADIAYVCLRSATGTYSWKQVVSG